MSSQNLNDTITTEEVPLKDSHNRGSLTESTEKKNTGVINPNEKRKLSPAEVKPHIETATRDNDVDEEIPLRLPDLPKRKGDMVEIMCKYHPLLEVIFDEGEFIPRSAQYFNLCKKEILEMEYSNLETKLQIYWGKQQRKLEIAQSDATNADETTVEAVPVPEITFPASRLDEFAYKGLVIVSSSKLMTSSLIGLFDCIVSSDVKICTVCVVAINDLVSTYGFIVLSIRRSVFIASI